MIENPTIKRPVPIDEEVLWDKTTTLMSRTNKHGHIMETNKAFQEVSGYTEAEFSKYCGKISKGIIISTLSSRTSLKAGAIIG